MLIPRIFHQIWLGPDPYPEKREQYAQTWLDLNPGWSLRRWTEESLPPDRRRSEAAELLRSPAERTDILRLEVLRHEGGVYVDGELECLRSIEPLIEGLDFFGAQSGPERIGTELLGATPGHPILEQALAELQPAETYGYDGAAGSALLGRVLRNRREVTVFAADVVAGYAARRDVEPSTDDLRAELAELEQLVAARQAEAYEWKRRAKGATRARPAPAPPSAGEQLIPQVFHQIWVGPDPLPDEYAAYRQTWIDHHPGWELRDWNEGNIPADVRRPEVHELLRNPAERSDILRYELLWRFGGVYVDSDFECLRPIDPLLGGVELFAGYRKPGRANNALIGSIPGHPLVGRALEEIRPRTTYGPVDKDGTGPPFLDRLLADFPKVTLFEPSVLYPRSHRGREDAYAIHHRARTWKDTEGLRSSVRKAKRRLERATDDLRRWQLEAEASAKR